MADEVWITGIGLISSLGEGADAHWQALTAADPRPVLAASAVPPYAIHPLCAVDLDRQIPRKGDQRQMEPWQRLGTYAAGLALDDAGVARNPDLLARTDMIVAAGGGERDVAVDAAVTKAMADAPDDATAGRVLNERLSNDLRPTLFLAQLSNLMAGNISIVHGVVGSSRTFMGEELAGAAAVDVAARRILAGQGVLALAGGAFSAARTDLILTYEIGSALSRAPWVPVWQRGGAGAGFIMGSLGAFLVLEAAGQARARGARGIARLTATATEDSGRAPGAAAAAAWRMWNGMEGLAPLNGSSGAPLGVLSGATGAAPALAEETRFLDALAAERPISVRGTGSLLGHGVEAQFAANIALAALAISRSANSGGAFYPPLDGGRFERSAAGAVRDILVTGFGVWRGEALALVSPIEENGA